MEQETRALRLSVFMNLVMAALGLAFGWLFTHNTNFWGGSLVEQRLLLAVKAHLIRSLGGGRWFGVGTGYGLGGRAIVNGVERDTRISSFRFGGTFTDPLGKGHSKLSLNTGARIERGPDFDAIAVAYQYLW